MTARLLEDGAPLRVEGLDDRVGHGPWARWLASAAVPFVAPGAPTATTFMPSHCASASV